MTLFNVETKLSQLAELEERMGATDFWNDQDAAQATVAQMKLLKSQVVPITEAGDALDDAKIAYELAREEGDDDMLVEADESLHALESRMGKIELQSLLSGKHDHRDCFVTISSGDGGTEADDWCQILLRMYLRYFEQSHTEWKVEELSMQHGSEAGVSNVTLHVRGPFAYGYLSAERGTHRLARVSPFNAQGKRQTSFSTVDVIPEFEETDLEIPDKDLEISYFARSSGPGGQNVNKVASACRIVHKPTGLSVVSSTHRDQSQNKSQSMRILMAKLELIEEEKRAAELADATGGAVDRGWGTQIRSYVFYDNRVKDHRTGYEVMNPMLVLDGELDGFIDAELKRRRSVKEKA